MGYEKYIFKDLFLDTLKANLLGRRWEVKLKMKLRSDQIKFKGKNKVMNLFFWFLVFFF